MTAKARPRPPPLRLRRHPARPLRHDARRRLPDDPRRRATRTPVWSGTSASSSTRASSRCGRSARCRRSTRQRGRRSCGARPSTSSLPSDCRPDTFEFSGFVVVRATDVTDQEVLSAIERDLIDKESIVSTRAIPGARGQAPDAPPPARAPPGPGGVPGRTSLRPELQLRDRARLHLRGHRAPPDERLPGVRPRAGGDAGPAARHATTSRRAAADRVRGLAPRPGRAQHPGRPAALPGQGDRHARADLDESGRSGPGEPDQAPRGAPALLDGCPAEPRRARGARPGGHQGEVHGHPSLGRVAVPARRARQHRGPRRRGGHRARADRLPGHPSALCGDGHPRVVRAAEPRGPGRSWRAPPAGPRRRRGRARRPARSRSWTRWATASSGTPARSSR